MIKSHWRPSKLEHEQSKPRIKNCTIHLINVVNSSVLFVVVVNQTTFFFSIYIYIEIMPIIIIIIIIYIGVWVYSSSSQNLEQFSKISLKKKIY